MPGGPRSSDRCRGPAALAQSRVRRNGPARTDRRRNRAPALTAPALGAGLWLVGVLDVGLVNRELGGFGVAVQILRRAPAHEFPELQVVPDVRLHAGSSP